MFPRSVIFLVLVVFVLVNATSRSSAQKLKQTLKGHDNYVMSVAFLPDGKRLVSTGWDKCIKIWDLTSGKAQVTMPSLGHFSYATQIKYSKDGKTLFSGGIDQTVVLWDVATGLPRMKYAEHKLPEKIRPDRASVTFDISPNQKTVASVGDKGTVKLWSTATGKTFASLEIGRNGQVRFSPDGKMLATPDGKNGIALRNVKSLQKVQSFANHPDTPLKVQFRQAGKSLVVVCNDGTVHFWDVASGKKRRTAELGNSLFSLAFSPDGDTLAATTYETIKLMNLSTGKTATLSTKNLNARLAVFSPDNNRLFVYCFKDRKIRAWDVKTHKCVLEFDRFEEGIVGILCMSGISPDGKTLSTADENSAIRMWDTSTGKQTRILCAHRQEVLGVKVSPSGKLFATCGYDTRVIVHSAERGDVVAVHRQDGSFYRAIDFHPKMNRLAIMPMNGPIWLWDWEHSIGLRLLPGQHTEPVACLTYSPDGKFLASGGRGQTVHLTNAEDKKSYAVLKGHTAIVTSVAFHPDGKVLASGSGNPDRTIKLWDVKRKKLLATLNNKVGCECVAFRPDGKLIATAGYDGSIRLWNFKTRKLVSEFEGHSKPAVCVTFSADGQTLATSGFDRLIKVWDVSDLP